MQREKKREFPNPRRADSSSAENRRRISYTQNENGYIPDSSVIKSRIWISVDISACMFSATWISWKRKWSNSGSSVSATMAAMIFPWNVHSIIVRWKRV